MLKIFFYILISILTGIFILCIGIWFFLIGPGFTPRSCTPNHCEVSLKAYEKGNEKQHLSQLKFNVVAYFDSDGKRFSTYSYMTISQFKELKEAEINVPGYKLQKVKLHPMGWRTSRGHGGTSRWIYSLNGSAELEKLHLQLEDVSTLLRQLDNSSANDQVAILRAITESSFRTEDMVPYLVSAMNPSDAGLFTEIHTLARNLLLDIAGEQEVRRRLYELIAATSEEVRLRRFLLSLSEYSPPISNDPKIKEVLDAKIKSPSTIYINRSDILRHFSEKVIFDTEFLLSELEVPSTLRGRDYNLESYKKLIVDVLARRGESSERFATALRMLRYSEDKELYSSVIQTLAKLGKLTSSDVEQLVESLKQTQNAYGAVQIAAIFAKMASLAVFENETKQAIPKLLQLCRADKTSYPQATDFAIAALEVIDTPSARKSIEECKISSVD